MSSHSSFQSPASRPQPPSEKALSVWARRQRRRYQYSPPTPWGALVPHRAADAPAQRSHRDLRWAKRAHLSDVGVGVGGDKISAAPWPGDREAGQVPDGYTAVPNDGGEMEVRLVSQRVLRQKRATHAHPLFNPTHDLRKWAD